MIPWTNRLTVLGSEAQVTRFQDSHWDTLLQARHCVLLEKSPRRFACQFDTASCPLEPLRTLALQWPRLVFLLQFESEDWRLIGLAKAKAQQVQHCKIRY